MRRTSLALWLLAALLLAGLPLSSAQDTDAPYPRITPTNADQLAALASLGGDIGPIAISPDDHWLVLAGKQGVWIFDKTIENCEPRLLTGHDGPVRAVDFAPDSRTFATGGEDGSVRLWDVITGDSLAVLTGHSDAVSALDISPDGALLASGGVGTDQTLRIWDLSDYRELLASDDLGTGLVTVKLLPSVGLVAAGTGNNTLAVWDVNTGQILGESNAGFNGTPTSLDYHPEKPLVVIGLSSGRVILADLESGAQQNLDHHSGGVRDVAYSRDGRFIATVGSDNSVFILDGETGALLKQYAHEDDLFSVAFSGDDQRVYAASDDGKLMAWELASDAIVCQRNLAYTLIRQITLSADGSLLVAATDQDYMVHVWDTATYQELAALPHQGRTFAAALSPDDTLLATAAAEPLIRLWDMATFQPHGALQITPTQMMSVAFSPDGTRVIGGGFDGTVNVIDLATGEILFEADSGLGTVWDIGYSADGAYFGYDEAVWDAATFARVTRPDGLTLPTRAEAFSPDGRVSFSPFDANVRLFDTATRETLGLLQGHAQPVASVALSPDGTRLYTGGYDGTLRAWAITGDTPSVEVACCMERGSAPVIDALPAPPSAPVAAAPDSITLSNAQRLQLTYLDISLTTFYDLDMHLESGRGAVAAAEGAALLDIESFGAPVPLMPPADSGLVNSALALDFSSDGQRLAISYGAVDPEAPQGAGVILWDLSGSTPTPALVLPRDVQVSTLAFNNAGDRLALGDFSGYAELLETARGEVRAALVEDHLGSVLGMNFSPDDRVLASVDTNGNKALWDAQMGTLLAVVNDQINVPMVFSADGDDLLSAEMRGFIRRSTTSGEALDSYAYPDALRGDIADVDPISERVLVTAADSLWLLDFNTGTGTQSTLIDVPMAAAVLRGDTLLSVSECGTLARVDLAAETVLGSRMLNTDTAYSASAFSADGSRLIAAVEDEGLVIYDAATGRLSDTLPTTHTDALLAAPSDAASGDDLLLTAGWDSAALLDLAAGAPVTEVDKLPGDLLRLSGDSTVLAQRITALQQPDQMRIYNLRTGQTFLLTPHIDGLNDIAINAEGTLLATAGAEGLVKLINPLTGLQVAGMPDSDGAVTALAFTPDGSTLVGITAWTLFTWDVSGGFEAVALSGSYPLDGPLSVRRLQVAPDNLTLFAETAGGRQLLVFDLSTGAQVAAYTLPGLSNSFFAYNPNGSQVAYGSRSGMLVMLQLADSE